MVTGKPKGSPLAPERLPTGGTNGHCNQIMELALQSPLDSPKKRAGRKPHRPTRPQLLTRDQLDGRTNAAKVFDRLVVDIEADLGGRDQLSTIERALVEAFAGACVTLHHLNTKLALGEQIDLSEHAQAVSAMVRVATRLGIAKRPRDITSGLDGAIRQTWDNDRAGA
jgi:hypothetical protein